MTHGDGPERFRLLATFVAGRSVEVAMAAAGTLAHTDGHVVFVSPGADIPRQRREVLLQSALIGAGSVKPSVWRTLRGRPALARRYLAIEGRRVFADLAERVPHTEAVSLGHLPRSSTSAESLHIARVRTPLLDPPDWFGVIKPSRLAAASPPTSSRADDDVVLHVTAADAEDDTQDGEEDDRGGPSEESRILTLFETPIALSESMANLFRKLLGTGRSDGDGDAGGALRTRSVRRAPEVSPYSRPTPTRIRFTEDGTTSAALGVGGAWYPEWDVHHGRYRANWCRVVDFSLAAAADQPAAPVPRDAELHRRLSRIALAPRMSRRRPDGDELDIESLTDLVVDLRSGYSPPERVYAERRMIDRDLSVLILLDASGSVTDTDTEGLAVHEHQRRAAATIAATLVDLGDRVAVYGFRSHGRHAVHLPAIKTFDQHLGAAERACLDRLRPSGYTRLGAGIRGAGAILRERAGTPNRLLLVLSDGVPYDHGYEGRYAEADAARSFDELRADGVACLCLSLGSDAREDGLERAFGTASHVSAPALADLSPRMGTLFASALAELRTPAARGRATG